MTDIRDEVAAMLLRSTWLLQRVIDKSIFQTDTRKTTDSVRLLRWHPVQFN